jgi:hypothetical protein
MDKFLRIAGVAVVGAAGALEHAAVLPSGASAALGSALAFLAGLLHTKP